MVLLLLFTICFNTWFMYFSLKRTKSKKTLLRGGEGNGGGSGRYGRLGGSTMIMVLRVLVPLEPLVRL